ncbi:MAG: 2-phospho-L-lactate guanylyltransferase [Alphaproteobacteria bacterium]|nr:2-phospho-L-lactate guanylyltransferase [Alphaproteobacteria bacterium]
MTSANGIWAVVPVKDTAAAKQRLASAVPQSLRQELMLAMLEDVLAALAEATGLAGRLLVTTDPAAQHLATRYGFDWLTDGAGDGHTGAVAAAARHLARTGAAGMLTVPGDIPLVTAAEIVQLLDAHRPTPSFTIAPSHDELGSNAIVVSPPNAVPLRFGDNSFFPHLAAAEAQGIRPTVLHLPGIALDIDNPDDLRHFARLGSRTRAGLWLAQNRPVLAAAIGRPED